MTTTKIIIELDRDTFVALPHARTRMVLTDSTERRDLIDEFGRVFAFSQRVAVRSERTGVGHRNAGDDANRETKYYVIRHDPVVKVLP